MDKKCFGSTQPYQRTTCHPNVLILVQALSEWERQRADESEKKFSEAVESSENKRMKLEETERRVFQLQESLDRYHCCKIFHSKSFILVRLMTLDMLLL